MTKKNYSKYEAKEELVTLSFNHVLLHKKDTKIYQVIFLSLLNKYLIFYNSLIWFGAGRSDASSPFFYLKIISVLRP